MTKKPEPEPTPKLRRVCAWCPDFDRNDKSSDVTHTICPACSARLLGEHAPPPPDDDLKTLGALDRLSNRAFFERFTRSIR